MSKNTLVLLSLLVSGSAISAGPAPVVDVNGGNLEQRLSTLERMVGTRTQMQQQMQQQLDSVQNEVNELRGSVELHTHKLEQILERQRELYQEIDKRIESVMQKKPALTPMLPVPDGSPASTTPAAPDPVAGESEAYDQAVNLILKEKRYDDAIPMFEAFLQKYPDSSYAANAYYWLGQLLFNKQNWSEAKNKFSYLVATYTDSTKRADSILKLGMIAQKQNNLSEAEQLFNQVVSEYAGTTAAKLAESRLKNIK
ncbi:tol-pal system protein YbgF [Neptunicella marina]|uniref:Cell division coordinator CpoB n=1 Tax=Neptunicella marina TaxID=2125989 RepID=A0A8J6LVN1_9ALTE|nr:tol-pal system protein YbgF [Neptunicella marina]MBC3764709.1 tol-pal system protein YbgF [Neptunicella marina]